MAVVRKTISGLILNELIYYEQVYKKNNYSPQLYQIEEPFRMQSQIDAIRRGGTNSNQKRKRVKKAQTVQRVDEDLIQFCNCAELAFNCLVEEGRKMGLFNLVKPVELLDNNKIAKEALTKLQQCDSCPRTSICNSSKTIAFEEDANVDELFNNCIYYNTKNDTVKLTVSKNSYVIPPLSKFICGDVYKGVNVLIDSEQHLHCVQFKEAFCKDQPNFGCQKIETVRPHCEQFDLIIIDPPWENKSVKRKRNYEMLSEKDLLHLPVDRFLTQNGLLVLWMTNNRRLQTFVRESLLEKWEVEIMAEWIWLKTTLSGEPVCEFRCDFKLPFEMIYICKRLNSSSFNCDVPGKEFLLSVPCVVPSRKVPLTDVLKPFLPENYSTLELFARNLQPNSTSIGDEVLKMQHESCFEL